MTTETQPVVKYLDLDDQGFYAVTMAGEDKRQACVQRLYPDYAYDPNQGPLANWKAAIAQANGVTLDRAGEAIRNITDPIYGGDQAATVGRFVWFLA